MGRERAWQAWLTGMEDAATALDRQLAAGVPVWFPTLPMPPVSGPESLPAAVRPRAAQAVAHLQRVLDRTQRRRDELARQLSALPVARRAPAAGYDYEIGVRLDVAG
jgi:hypothetical protein